MEENVENGCNYPKFVVKFDKGILFAINYI